MGYYISHLIGIRTGGVFSEESDMDGLKKQVSSVIESLRQTDNDVDMADDPSHCMSKELQAHKGNYVVLAGVFNYWHFEQAEEFCKRLSVELKVEVMHMAWDEEENEVQCQIWLDGEPLFEISENPIGRILRRLASQPLAPRQGKGTTQGSRGQVAKGERCILTVSG